MSKFTVRSIFQWATGKKEGKTFSYEERITMWEAESLDQAIEFAEKEAEEYEELGAKSLGLFQCYSMFEEVELAEQGIEIFSLIRDSNLKPQEYLDSFFDTGFERQQNAKPNQTS